MAQTSPYLNGRWIKLICVRNVVMDRFALALAESRRRRNLFNRARSPEGTTAEYSIPFPMPIYHRQMSYCAGGPQN